MFLFYKYIYIFFGKLIAWLSCLFFSIIISLIALIASNNIISIVDISMKSQIQNRTRIVCDIQILFYHISRYHSILLNPRVNEHHTIRLVELAVQELI